jgi:hypothetical protein
MVIEEKKLYWLLLVFVLATFSGYATGYVKGFRHGELQALKEHVKKIEGLIKYE